MRWQTGRRSGNIEDRRGIGIGGIGGIGGIIILIVALLTGIDPAQLAGMIEGGGSVPAGTSERKSDPQSDFVASVLADTEDTWARLFQERGASYQPPRLVLFEGSTPSACGMGQAAMGPFYCPSDQKLYIDLSFFRELDRRFGAPGDFAQAYVIAHEVGHHVQHLIGIDEKIRSAQSRSRAGANKLQVQMELQADCLAGVWGHRANNRKLLEAGDIEEGLRAAAAIGDDVLQRRSSGHVSPESWTHGSSQQRASALRRGLESGQPEQCK